MEHLVEIARHKERLIARCAAQRDAVAGVFRDLERPIAVADRALGIARFFRAHPILVFAAVAAIVALRRRGSMSLIARGLAAWRMWRGISTWAGRIGLDFPRGHRQERTGDVAS
jgi:hypothetical protein